MAFDIKKTAIGLGCVAVIAFVLGRSNFSSDNSDYQSLTSLTHLDQSDEQATEPPQSTVVEHEMLFPAQEVEASTVVLESENQVALSDSEFSEFPEPNHDFLELEVPDDSLPVDSQPLLDAPAIDEVTDQSMKLPESTEGPIETIAQLPEPVEVMDSPITTPESSETTPSEKTTDLKQPSRPKWKQNPFISTKAPAFSPVDRTADNKIQTASMATTAQGIRSLNDIDGIPAMDPSSAPTETIPPVHNAGSMTNIGTPIASIGTPMTNIGTQIAPVQIELPESAAQKAVHHIEYGKSLSRRGASYAARNEFFSALRVIAEANDAVINGNEFSTALSKSIRAMKEAEDFAAQDSQGFGIVDVPATIEAHKTKLLTPIEARQITPLNAMRRYYAYAGQQLDFAGGRNVVTAEALHCLGKLHSVISSQQPVSSGKIDISQAIVFHRSSLLSNSNNPASANELGVLLAKSGELNEATNLFKQSLIAQSTPQAWSNLAKTHQRLGESQLAQMAKAEIPIAAQSTSIATAGIRWIDTPQFNAMAPLEFEPRIAQKVPKITPTVSANKTKAKDEKPKASIAERIKEWF